MSRNSTRLSFNTLITATIFTVLCLPAWLVFFYSHACFALKINIPSCMDYHRLKLVVFFLFEISQEMYGTIPTSVLFFGELS